MEGTPYDILSKPSSLIMSNKDSVNTVGKKTMMKYIPPHARLYQARHKLMPKDLATDTIDLEVSDRTADDLLSYNVPFINLKRCTVYSQCTSVFSVKTAPTTPDTLENEDKQLGFALGQDLCTLMERNISLDSVAASSSSNLFGSQESINFVASLNGSSGRLPTLPPREAEESSRHLQRINELKNRIKKTEAKTSHKIEQGKLKAQRRSKYVSSQWVQLVNMSKNVWLIEIRKRGLQWDGIPWDFKNEIYSMCLWDLKLDCEHIPNSAISRLCQAMERIFFDRTSELAGNFFRSSQWWQQVRPDEVTLQRLEAEYPSLFYHFHEILKLDIWKDLLFSIPLNAITNAILHHPADFPTYEDYLLRLFDGLVISAYYNECDLAWLKITEYTLRNNHYKFFGDTKEIKEQLKTVQLDIYGVLQWLQQP